MRNKTKISKWIKVENDIVTVIHASNTVQPDMIKIPWNSNVKLHSNIKWYDGSYKRISDKCLIEMGIRNDNRGTYYNKNDYRIVFIIRRLDVEIPNNFTSIKPVENEPCLWDGEKWVINENKKETDKIYKRLIEIDAQSGAGRKIRSIAVAVGNFMKQIRDSMPELALDPVSSEELQDVIHFEKEAEMLRKQLKELSI